MNNSASQGEGSSPVGFITGAFESGIESKCLLTFSGLDDLIHADTMLFILGLTLFVSVIAQTRVLEGITFFLLRKNGGRILPTVIAVTAVVAITSGMLGGVSMIGLTIRTFVIILMLGAAPIGAVRYAVMVCTAVTTICEEPGRMLLSVISLARSASSNSGTPWTGLYL